MLGERGLFPDLDRVAEILGARGSVLGRPLHRLRETTSTNDEAKRAAKSGAPHGSTWIAETQTAGRGRQGRAWVSPPGENLLFSVLLRTTCTPSRLPPLALVAGLAVRDAVARAVGAEGRPAQPQIKLKWPNDVVSGPHRTKVAGVLVEATMLGSRVDAVIVGIGINVHTRDFPGELEGRATSVARLGAPAPDRGEILADVLSTLDRDAELALTRGLGLVHGRLSDADALHGETVRGDAGTGRAEGIDLEGRLLVRGGDGVLMRWGAGEVHLVGYGS